MIDYDPNDVGPINKAEMLNSSGAMRTPVWSDVTVRSNPSEMSRDSHLFVRVPTRGAYTGNLRLTDSGTCFVATTEVPFETGDVGEIWVDYDITFHVPAIAKAEPLSTESRALGSVGDILGTRSPYTAVPGSATSFKVSNLGSASILEFEQDFNGMIHLECYEDQGTNQPPLLTVDTQELNGATPALIGTIDNIKDTIFGASKLLVSVAAKAGDALRIIEDETGTAWVFGETIMRLMPYAKVLMGALAPIITLEEQVVAALKQNPFRGKKHTGPELINLAKQLIAYDPSATPTQRVDALVDPTEYNVTRLIVSLQRIANNNQP
jgi:hypothetical protein